MNQERPATRKRFYHFSFLRPGANQGARLHELRDGDAFAELAPVLLGQGYEYGGLLLNYPDPDGAGGLRNLQRDDLVVLTTRPPVDDAAQERRPIARSDSALETKILTAAERHFAKSSRMLVRLSKVAARHLQHHADRGEIWFRVYELHRKTEHPGQPSGSYRRYGDPYANERSSFHKPKHPQTAAYLVRTPITPGGPHLLNAFGMDGVTTLLWCYLLRTKYPHLLQGPRFAMVEIDRQEIPRRPTTLAFVDKWKVRFLIDVPAI